MEIDLLGGGGELALIGCGEASSGSLWDPSDAVIDRYSGPMTGRTPYRLPYRGTPRATF